MDEDFVKEQAAQFALVIKHGVSKFENLSLLKERLEKELGPYIGQNKSLFLQHWKQELDRLFFDHFKTCPDPSKCPQHKTSKNATFLYNQFNQQENSEATKSNFLKHSDNHDLNYYFNAGNIPNQELVFETYNFFKKGPGKEYFEPLEFLNLLNWHYRFLTTNVTEPFSVLSQFKHALLNDIQKHLLIGFTLKWFGGYPVNNLNSQFNSTLKLLELEYSVTIEEVAERKQQINNEFILRKSLSIDQEFELKELEEFSDFLSKVDKVIANREMRLKLKNLEEELNKSLRSNHPIEKPKSVSDLFIFISHASMDREIIKLFVDKILQLGLHINLDKIFCTSIQSTTITTGEDFRAVIKEKLMKASHVIQIITSNYKASEVCMNEMGAAWVLSNKVIPFILPPVSYSSVGFIHSPSQLLKLNDENDLLKFVDEMKIKDQLLLHSEVKRQIEDFVKALNAF